MAKILAGSGRSKTAQMQRIDPGQMRSSHRKHPLPAGRFCPRPGGESARSPGQFRDAFEKPGHMVDVVTRQTILQDGCHSLSKAGKKSASPSTLVLCSRVATSISCSRIRKMSFTPTCSGLFGQSDGSKQWGAPAPQQTEELG